MHRLNDWLRMMRVNQWTKNLVVLAAYFFAFWDREHAYALGWDDFLKALTAVACFSLAASGIYLFNDIRDLESDRQHPVKRLRPLAAGRLAVGAVAIGAILLSAAGLVGASFLRAEFALVLGGYMGLQLLYSCGFKRVALVDVLMIACGFVLRAIGGAVVCDVSISPWLLVCTFLLALFLGFGKRRHEKRLLLESGGVHRVSLEDYSERLLDQLIAVTCSATIVCYSIYTLWPGTAEKFGTAGLPFSIPFVAFGMFRYMDLVYRLEGGGRPEKILLTDVPLIVNFALYGVTLLAVFVLGGH